jgi:hypothetical protein
MTSKTPAEIAAMDPEERAKWDQDELNHVYGVGFQRDRRGKPVEQGRGSASNPTEQHFQALERYEGREVAVRARKAANA